MSGAPRAFGNEEVVHPKATADCCILLWMAGGMAAPETFDPKGYQPFEKACRWTKILSTFPAIDTSLDGVKISAGPGGNRQGDGPRHPHPLARPAGPRHHPPLAPPIPLAHRIRPAANRRRPAHRRVDGPVLGPRNPVMPAFINIGQRLEGIGESEELKAFTTGGFFGAEYGPFNLPDPDDAARSVRPPEGMDPGRFANRYKLYQKLVDANPHRDFMSDHQQEVDAPLLDNAHRLLRLEGKEAFDLSVEPRSVLDAYGSGRFGRGCLLARRLAESGARFIEVTTEYVPFLHWDTHENGHETAVRLKRKSTARSPPSSATSKERGMLDRTLVIIATEFSRDMMIEGVPGSDRQGPVAREIRHPRGTETLRPAPPLHRRIVGRDVRRRHEKRPRPRSHRRRAPAGRRQGPRHHHRPPRHDLHRHGHQPENGLSTSKSARSTPPKTAKASWRRSRAASRKTASSPMFTARSPTRSSERTTRMRCR
jgi:hypothetical protein